MRRIPPEFGCDILIVVTVDIASAGHVLSGDGRVPRLHVVRQAARRLGDDLKATYDSIEGLEIALERAAIEPSHKHRRELDVMKDVAKGCADAVRRHRGRRRLPPIEYMA